ncbi:MAG: ornithine cyclodeaminase family protein [Candidatus Bathyarchaeota archaeon]|nr:ornithine cyclodeaminase family protein [Candidatus Bathyarchaeota archaeon]MDH5713892.1 ornithine cyclodeaminase family protein [Candidatus Bathyarchaeota archaeon]
MSLDVLYLSKEDIEETDLTMAEIINVVEEALREKGEGRVEMPPKPGIHPRTDAFIHAMPAFIPRMKAAGVKWVSGFPSNRKYGLPYIMGVLVLNDPETGAPICIMDASWVTAKRTGAATAVAAKYLARKDSKVFGILGCGVQGRNNLEALFTFFKGLEEVRAYDISQANLQRYVSEMREKHGLSVVPVDSPKKAVEECDMVVTAGPILKHPKPVIDAGWFDDGGFACPLDFDSYWKPQAMHSMHKFCTDDVEQLLYYQSVGYFKDIPNVYADLGELATGKKPARENDSERTMSMNLGLAIEDMATAVKIYEKAKSKGIGTWLKL